jgi:hypothetical protein
VIYPGLRWKPNSTQASYGRAWRMTDRALLEFGRAAGLHVQPVFEFGLRARTPFVLQLEAARAEWRRGHRRESSPGA